MEWIKLLNRERLRWPLYKSKRLEFNPFFVDEDCIVFSQPFRRLKDKTQVHPLSDNDHVRTRLTHSLEVSSIGHALGTLAGKEIIARYELENICADDIARITKAACLAHDIGNPPFGHIGEQAIEEWFCHDAPIREQLACEMSEQELVDFKKFDGNAQGFRILTNKENYKGNGGLRLTFATLGTMIKYPWGSASALANHGKFGYFLPEQQYVLEIAAAIGLNEIGDSEWCRHPLAYLVEAADDICYSIIDLEDGIEIGAITFGRFEERILAFLSDDKDFDRWHKQYKDLDELGQKVSFLRSKVIFILVEQVASAFATHEEQLSNGQFTGSILDRCDGGAFVHELKKIAASDVFPHSRKRFLEIASYTVLHGLLEDFARAAALPQKSSKKNEFLLSLMGRDSPLDGETVYQRLRKVVDFVSGMTDRYALEMYRQLRGISIGSAVAPPAVK